MRKGHNPSLDRHGGSIIAFAGLRAPALAQGGQKPWLALRKGVVAPKPWGERHVLKTPIREYASPADGQIVLGNGNAALDDDLLLVLQLRLAILFQGLGQIIRRLGGRLGIVTGRIGQNDPQLIWLAVRRRCLTVPRLSHESASQLRETVRQDHRCATNERLHFGAAHHASCFLTCESLQPADGSSGAARSSAERAPGECRKPAGAVGIAFASPEILPDSVSFDVEESGLGATLLREFD